MTRVLVCGGRKWGELLVARGAPPDQIEAARALQSSQKQAVFDDLSRIMTKRVIDIIIEGGAAGADACAKSWAFRHWVKSKTYKADWKRGPAAGPMRNQRMIDDGKPDLVLAFPGGKGTLDMITRARAAGIEVIDRGEIKIGEPVWIDSAGKAPFIVKALGPTDGLWLAAPHLEQTLFERVANVRRNDT